MAGGADRKHAILPCRSRGFDEGRTAALESHVRSVLTDGPVAQLGARLNGIQEVTGSIPVRSTNLRSLTTRRLPAVAPKARRRALRPLTSFGWQAILRLPTSSVSADPAVELRLVADGPRLLGGGPWQTLQVVCEPTVAISPFPFVAVGVRYPGSCPAQTAVSLQ
jgi:hypothetical protein